MKRIPLLVLLALACNADVSVGEISVNGKKVHEDLAVPQSFELTPAYGKKHGIEIPIRAHVEVPRGDSVAVFEGEEAAGAWIQFEFADASGKLIAERLSVSSVFVAVGPPKERMATLEKMLITQVLPQVAKRGTDFQFHGSRPATIDGNNAVIVVGQYTEPTGEVMLVGVAATLLADDAQGAMVVGQAVQGTSPIANPGEVGTKGALFDILQTLSISKAKDAGPQPVPAG